MNPLDQTQHGKLKLPDRLIQLIQTGKWPTSENSEQQNLKPIYPNEDAYKDRFLMGTLYLYPTPFKLVSEDIQEHPAFWADQNLAEYFGQPLATGIEPSLALILGDFGPGTDAILAMDYRLNYKEPSILGMDYGEISHNKGWSVMASSFSEFADYLGMP